ncbi:MAG TPA: hypothetical protein VFX86_02555 [Candidatus Saccharimonadales bacterium]|nr:hypothetical protein [Candidatus Saccharimonadales bacterium]
MGAVPHVPPVMLPPAEKGRSFERTMGSTDDPEDKPVRSTTVDEPDEAVVGEIFDHAVHARKDFQVIATPKKENSPRRTFQPGSIEHTTLQALKKYGASARDRAKGAAKRTGPRKRK